MNLYNRKIHQLENFEGFAYRKIVCSAKKKRNRWSSKTVTPGCDLEEILVMQNAEVGALQSRTPTVAHQLRTVDLRSDEHAVETKW